MAEQRSSEGVAKIRFPRTDFPQQGWIRKPTVTGTTGDFYEYTTDFGWYGQTQCPRVGARPGRWPTTDPDDLGWVTSALTPAGFDQTLWPGIEQQTKSLRLARRRGAWPTTDLDDLGWLSSALAPAAGFDETLWPGIEQQTDSLRLARRVAWPTTDLDDLGWLSSPLTPAGFDAALWPGIEQQTDSVRLARGRRAWSTDTVVLGQPQWTAWPIAADRLPDRLRRGRPTDADLAWLSQFNAGLFAAIAAQQASGTTDARPRLDGRWVYDPSVGWLVPPAAAPAFDPTQHAWGIPDLRMAKATGRPVWWVFDADLGWITTNVPPVIVIPPEASFYYPTWRPRRR